MERAPDATGPIGDLIVELPHDNTTGDGPTGPVDPVDQGLIRSLDLVLAS